MQKIFTLSLVLFIHFIGHSQDRFIKIAFVSSWQIPLPDITVQTADAGYVSVSNENGVILVQGLSSGNHTLFASGLGYETKAIKLDTLSFQNEMATVVLSSKNVTLQDVTVSTISRKNILTTLSAIDIRLRPFTNSQEVLRLVPGLFIGQHAGGGKAEQIFLRGFDLDHGTDINITVDGLPVNMVSHAHGQGYADLHFVIPELIEKVGFNKGSYYANKGNFTTAGYVEFNTKNYLPANFIKVEGGSFHTIRSVAGVNLIKPTLANTGKSLYLAGEGFFSKGYFDSPQDFNRLNGLLKYYSPAGKKSIISILASGFTSKWKASGQVPERSIASGDIGFYGAIDDNEGGITSRYNASAELTTRFNNNGVLHNQVYYSRYNFELYSNFTFYKEDPVNGDQIRQKEGRNIFGYNGSYEKEYFIGSLKTQTTLGAQLRADDINDIELSRTKDRSVTTAALQLGDVNEVNTATYVSQKLFLAKRFTVTAGLRYDHFSNRYADKLTATTNAANASILSPKLNLDLALTKNTQLYFYNGRGFHSNDTRVVVAQKGKEILPPAYASDFGGVFKIGRKLVLQSAIWYLWLAQEFVYVGDEGIVEASGKSRRYGADASVRYEVAKHLFVQVDANYAVPKALEVPKGEDHLPLAPRFTSLGGLVYKKQSGFNGSLFYRVMTDRPATEDNSIVAKGYFILDAAVNYSSKVWEAGVSVQNLLNTRWKETQFATESRLQNEPVPVTEIHFTPGSPFFLKAHLIFLL